MNLSCTEMMLGERSLADKFGIARSSGFDGIDLRGDLIGPRIGEIRGLVRQVELPVATVYGRITIPLLSRTIAERQRALALVRDRLRDAAAIGTSGLIVVPIFGEAQITADRGQGVEEIEQALLLVLLRELAGDAEAARVRIIIEPLNRAETHLCTSPTETAALTRTLQTPWIGTMADTYHMDREEQDPVQEVESMWDQLMLVHLSDRDRTLPGEGGIDFAPLLRSLDTSGYDGFMGYECRGSFDADQLRASVDWIRAGAIR